MRNEFWLLYRRAVDVDRMASPVARALAQGFGPGRCDLRSAFGVGRSVLSIRQAFGTEVRRVCRLSSGAKLFDESPDPTQLLYQTVCPHLSHR